MRCHRFATLTQPNKNKTKCLEEAIQTETIAEFGPHNLNPFCAWQSKIHVWSTKWYILNYFIDVSSDRTKNTPNFQSKKIQHTTPGCFWQSFCTKNDDQGNLTQLRSVFRLKDVTKTRQCIEFAIFCLKIAHVFVFAGRNTMKTYKKWYSFIFCQ